jgi:hypothetical protein
MGIKWTQCNQGPQTKAEQITRLSTMKVTIAKRSAQFCILCENDIEVGEEYRDGGKYCKAHETCFQLGKLE